MKMSGKNFNPIDHPISPPNLYRELADEA